MKPFRKLAIVFLLPVVLIIPSSRADDPQLRQEAEKLRNDSTNEVSLRSGVAKGEDTETNSPIGQFRVRLKITTDRLDTVIQHIRVANKTDATNEAFRLRDAATNFLALIGADGPLGPKAITDVDQFVGNMRQSLEVAEKRSKSTDYTETVRQAYAKTLPGLREKLNQLVDARSRISDLQDMIRRRGKDLFDNAELLGFLNDIGEKEKIANEFIIVVQETENFVNDIALMFKHAFDPSPTIIP